MKVVIEAGEQYKALLIEIADAIKATISFEEKVKHQLLYDQIKKENGETTRRVIYS